MSRQGSGTATGRCTERITADTAGRIEPRHVLPGGCPLPLAPFQVSELIRPDALPRPAHRVQPSLVSAPCRYGLSLHTLAKLHSYPYRSFVPPFANRHRQAPGRQCVRFFLVTQYGFSPFMTPKGSRSACTPF